MRWTLRTKLTLGLAGILTAIMGLSLLLLTLSARQRLLEDYGRFAVHVNDVAEAGLENAMISRDPGEIRSVLQAIDYRSLAEADQQVTATLAELLFWALVTMITVIGVAIGFVHLLVARPLGHFARITRAVGEGDLSQRVGLTGTKSGSWPPLSIAWLSA